MDYLPENSAEFQAEAFTAEQKGQWAEEWLGFAEEKKLFHLAVPEKYDGHQLSLPKLLKIFEQASFLDGSFGWTLTLGAGAGVFAAFMHPDFAKKQLSKLSTFITGSGYPAGTAQETDKGFIGNGAWKYATGSPHATLFTASCVLYNKPNIITKNQSVRVLIFYPEEVTIKPSWNSYGLKATASHNFSVEDITVPPERSFTIDPSDLVIDEPLYRFPFQPFAESTLAASVSGIARHFLCEASSLLRSKADYSKEIEQQLEQSIEAVDKAWQKLLDHTGDAWELCKQGTQVNQQQQNKIAQAAKNITAVSLAGAQKVYPHCGMSILDESSVINRAWRDLHTASQHMFLVPKLK